MRIKTIKKNKLKEPKVYYDIEVEKHHNFSIGDANIIAHNSSLEQGIVNLAQDYVGSNNINILVPEGQFGTRLQGGKDAASSRYINTFLNPITKLIYDKRDEDILEEQYEDNYKIEPKTFKPIIPMVLVNGADGIGTGWSTGIPKYNPKDIIRLIENRLKGKKSNRIHPWYNGFKGDIEETDNGYITYGKFEAVNSTTIHITELPIGYWTQTFIEHLHKMIENKFIKDFEDNSTESNVNITIKVPRENMVKLSSDEHIITHFKLSSRLYTSNMHLFYKGNIKKYDSPESIVDDYYEMRLKDYKKRKEYLLEKIGKEKTKLDNQVKFIRMVISNKMKINNRKKDLIIKDLKKNKFDLYDDSYDYLLNMAIYSLSKDKIEELEKKAKEKDKEFKGIKKMTPKNLWLEDLDVVKKMI